jgi:hypothetical protein
MADDLSKTKNLMGALVRMKPKPHDEMKVGKKKELPVKRGARGVKTKKLT